MRCELGGRSEAIASQQWQYWHSFEYNMYKSKAIFRAQACVNVLVVFANIYFGFTNPLALIAPFVFPISVQVMQVNSRCINQKRPNISGIHTLKRQIPGYFRIPNFKFQILTPKLTVYTYRPISELLKFLCNFRNAYIYS